MRRQKISFRRKVLLSLLIKEKLRVIIKQNGKNERFVHYDIILAKELPEF